MDEIGWEAPEGPLRSRQGSRHECASQLDHQWQWAYSFTTGQDIKTRPGESTKSPTCFNRFVFIFHNHICRLACLPRHGFCTLYLCVSEAVTTSGQLFAFFGRPWIYRPCQSPMLQIQRLCQDVRKLLWIFMRESERVCDSQLLHSI